MSELNCFWQCFAAKANEYLVMPTVEIIDSVHKAWGEFDPLITAEISNRMTNGDRELILTSHGNAETFAAVTTLANAAPRLGHWIVSALKPPRGFWFRSFGHEKLNIANWQFVLLKAADFPGEYGLSIEVPEADGNELYDQLLRNIVEEGIGEVVLSQCRHMEWSTNVSGDAEPISRLYEFASSWVLVKGPSCLRQYLFDTEARSHAQNT